MQIIEINPRTVKRLPSKNPNLMEPGMVKSLARAMAAFGEVVPVVVVEEDGEPVLVDGSHRCDAAIAIQGWPDADFEDALTMLAEEGIKTTPQEIREKFAILNAVVARNREHAEMLRISVNRHRGDPDTTEIGKQFAAMIDSGFSKEDLELTGFEAWEISDLLENTLEPDDDDLLTGANIEMAPEKPKSYSLTFKFPDEVEKARVKQALEELGDGDVTEGLIAAIELASK